MSKVSVQSSRPRHDRFSVALMDRYWKTILFGMGIICGKGISYADYLLRRDDISALQQDIHAIAADMWIAIDKVDDELDIDVRERRVSEQETES